LTIPWLSSSFKDSVLISIHGTVTEEAMGFTNKVVVGLAGIPEARKAFILRLVDLAKDKGRKEGVIVPGEVVTLGSLFFARKPKEVRAFLRSEFGGRALRALDYRQLHRGDEDVVVLDGVANLHQVKAIISRGDACVVHVIKEGDGSLYPERLMRICDRAGCSHFRVPWHPLRPGDLAKKIESLQLFSS